MPVRAPPMFVDGKPDLSSARSAWMISTLRDGTNIAGVAGADGVQRMDPVKYFHKEFPPTLHGTADVFASKGVSLVASANLRELGVWTNVVEVEGAAHMFDIQLKEGDELFDGPVLGGLKFLARKAGLLPERQ